MITTDVSANGVKANPFSSPICLSLSQPIPRIQWSVASILTLSQLISMLFVLQIFKYIYFAPDYNHRITNISKLPCMVLQFSKFLALSSAKPLISSHTNFNFWQLISPYFSLSDRQLFLLLRCLCFRHWYFQIFYFIFFFHNRIMNKGITKQPP